MEYLVQGILGLIALACVVPLAVLAVEALSALCARPLAAESTTPRPRLAILVPAHDEELGLPRTLADIVAGLAAGDRCVVVADNCKDGTAQAARAFPVEVLERTDAEHRGKGYALQHGIAHLRADPPDVVLVIDADCRVEAASLPILARAAVATQRPVQGGNVLYPPPESSVGSRVSAFAFLFKNHVRPLGLSQWGGPCLLFGTGMAFPWSVLADASLGTADSVEDMQLAVKLSLAGKPALYVPTPCVSGELPAEAKEIRSQRQRWEHGHVRTLLNYAPRLLWEGVRRGRLDLLLLGLDLAVPPLSLLAFAVIAATIIEAIAWNIAGIWLCLCAILAVAVVWAVGAVLLAWYRFGRNLLSFKDLALIPFYIAGKVPIYLALLWRPQKAWSKPLPPAGLVETKEPRA